MNFSRAASKLLQNTQLSADNLAFFQPYLLFTKRILSREANASFPQLMIKVTYKQLQ